MVNEHDPIREGPYKQRRRSRHYAEHLALSAWSQKEKHK